MQNNSQEENPSDKKEPPKDAVSSAPSREQTPFPKSPAPAQSPQSQSPRAPSQAKHASAIRTMESDAQELMRGGKLTLADVLGKAIRSSARGRGEPSKTLRNTRIVLIAGGLFLSITLLGGIGAFFFFRFSPDTPTPEEKKAEQPPLFFRVNFSESIASRAEARAQFIRDLESLAKKSEIPRAITHVIVVQRDDAEERLATLGEIFTLLRVPLLEQLVIPQDKPPMMFIYYGERAGHIGFIFAPQDPDRTFSSFFAQERSLALDFAQAFFGEEVGRALAPFQDFTYRNVDWRYQAISQEKDRGVGYGAFPSRNLFMITTSKAAMEETINRLFEAQ